MTYYLFVDTETTGIPNQNLPHNHPSQPYMVQIGALLWDELKDQVITSLDAIIFPDKYTIDNESKAVETHGITQEKALQFGVGGKHVAGILESMIDMADKFVAYNERFDYMLCLRLLDLYSHDIGTLKTISRTCVMRRATPVCKIPATARMKAAGFGGFKNPRLAEAYKIICEKELVGAHSAMADVRATLEIHKALEVM